MLSMWKQFRVALWVLAILLAGCETELHPVIPPSGLFVRVMLPGGPVEGVRVDFSNQLEGDSYDITAANGFAIRYPIGGGQWEVEIAVLDSAQLQQGHTNPAIIDVESGEAKLHIFLLIPK